MATAKRPHEWLRRYGNVHEYQWRRATFGKLSAFQRPVGLVEFAFDVDGRYYEGRADVSSLLEVEIKSAPEPAALQDRIVLAWTRSRCQQLLLRARCVRDDTPAGQGGLAPLGMHFVVDVVDRVEDVVANAAEHTLFLEDNVTKTLNDFVRHSQNAGRNIDPDRSLSKLFVFRPEDIGHGHAKLKFLFVTAHEISDGLSNFVMARDFISYLNTPISDLQRDIANMIKPVHMQNNLPLPQEALYTPVPGSIARQRWFWAIVRVLRHVRRQLPAGFVNPLRRKGVREVTKPMPPMFDHTLDYTKVPPLNTQSLLCTVPEPSVRRLHRLCREAKASIGAGCFALVALTMMEMYEQQEPDVRPEDRKCFISGFPLNPRAFFHHHTEPNSVMLAFCDGIALPFLSADLDVDGRIRLLASQAHRQLASYQKRKKPMGDQVTRQFLQSRGPGLVLANQYLMSLERAELVLPEHLRTGVTVQGAYPARPNRTLQTCGVSSVGNQDVFIRGGIYDLDDATKGFAADFRSLMAVVRAREGECLIGPAGSANGLTAGCSIDASTMDPELVAQWQYKFEHVLDARHSEEKARL